MNPGINRSIQSLLVFKSRFLGWTLFTKQAQKDAKKLGSYNLKDKGKGLLEILENDPDQPSPHFEKFVGDNIEYSKHKHAGVCFNY